MMGNPWFLPLSLLTFAHVVGTLHSVSIFAMAPVIRDDLGLSFAQVGLFASAYNLGQMTGALPAGWFVDRIGVGKALVIAHGVLAVGAFLISRTETYPLLLLGLTTMGWGYALINPSTAKGVLEWFPRDRRGTAMGIKQTGVPLGGILAAAIGAVAAIIHWQTLMVGIAVVTLGGGALALLLVPHSKVADSARGNPLKNLGEVCRDWRFSCMVAASGMLNAGQYNFFQYLTLFVREAAGASQEYAGLCLGIAQATSAAARTGWGAFSDFYLGGRRKGLIIVLSVVAGVSFLAMTLVAPLGPTYGVVLATLLIAILGITIASYASLVQTMAVETVDPRLAGSAMGFTMLGTSAGGLVGPPAFGWIVDQTGWLSSGWVFSAVAVAIGVALLTAFRERPTSAPG